MRERVHVRICMRFVRMLVRVHMLLLVLTIRCWLMKMQVWANPERFQESVIKMFEQASCVQSAVHCATADVRCIAF